MTEAGWLTCTSPTPMLEFLRGKASNRKLRLFACACCRRVWHLLRDEASRVAVRTAEAFAEGNATEADLRVAFDAVSDFVAGGLGGIADRAVLDAVGNTGWPGSPATAVRRAVGAAFHAAHAACGVTLERIRALPRGKRVRAPFDAERDAQVALIHCVFGVPFRSVAINRNWLTGDVLGLARYLDAEGTFTDLPVLADALQDAGCDSSDILDHCRGSAVLPAYGRPQSRHDPHVRGCFVVDLLLGKE